MAEAYGNQVQHWRCYVKAYIASQTDTTATIKCETYWQSLSWGYDTGANASATVNGQTESTGRFTAHSGSGQSVTQHCVTKTLTVSKGASGYNVWCSGTVNLIGGYHNGTSSAGVNVYVPVRTYYQPHPPKSFAASRVSDTQSKLTWLGDYTGMDGGYPWNGVYVDRSTDGGPWQTIATLGCDAVNYTDNSTQANHSYQYGLRSKGPGGTSVRVTAATIYNTPAAPASVTLSKVMQTTVRIEADVSGVRTATNYEVESKTNGMAWEGAIMVDGFPVTLDAGGGTTRFRVRSVRGMLESAWTESDDITTITPPLAPSVTVSPGQVVPLGTNPTIRWTPNHPDGTSQSAAQVLLTRDGQQPATIDVGTDTELLVPYGDAEGSCRYQVRTKGLHADWGSWSQQATFTVAAPPSVHFTSPAIDGTVVKLLPLEISWEVTDKTGVAAQSLVIRGSDGSTVLYRELPTDSRSLAVGISDGLADKSSYEATIEVRGGSTLKASNERSFSTLYNGPAEPTVAVATGYGLSASIRVEYGISGTMPATTSVDVHRLVEGGAVLIASGLESGQAAIDPLPPLNVPVEYVVTAYSGIGTMTVVSCEHVVDSNGFEAFNFGRAAERCYVLGLDAAGSESVSHSGESFRFALGPDTPSLPTFYPDGGVDASGSHSYVATDLATFDGLRAESRRRDSALCWFRDAFGGRAFCLVSMKLGYDARRYGVYDVSIDLTEVVWEEPVNA